MPKKLKVILDKGNGIRTISIVYTNEYKETQELQEVEEQDIELKTGGV